MNFNESPPIKWMRENQDLLVNLIQELVRIPSVSGKELEAQKTVYKRFKELDLTPKFVNPDEKILRDNRDYFETTSFVKYGYNDRPNVTGLMKGSGNGKSICLSGHIDVVSPEPIDQWNHGPWSGDREGDFIYGRGSGDMKAGVAAMILTIQALKETQTHLKGDVFIETTIEEEDGGIGGSLYMRLTQPKPDAAIIPEPFGLTVGIASAGIMYFRVIVTGFPAHAATAHFGKNAILKIIPVIEALKSLNTKRQKAISYPYVEVDPRMKGRATTLNIGVIRAGDWPSTVPALCELECRVGFPPSETQDVVINQIETTIMEAAKDDPWLKEHPPKIEWFGWKARPHEQNPEDPFVKLVETKINQFTGTKPLYKGGSAGLDARFFAYQGIPVVTLGPIAENIHSTDERVGISSTLKTAELIIATMMEWCEVEGKN